MSTASTSRLPAPRDAAIIAAGATFGMAVAGLFGNATVLSLIGTDASATATLLEAGLPLLRLAVVALLIVAALDVVLAWAITRYFGATHRDLAQLAGWLRVTYTAVLIAAIGHLVSAVRLTHEGSAAEAHSAMLDFGSTWQLGLVIFGCHLAVLAILLVRESSTPTWLGVVIGIAAIGYAANGIATVLLPSDAALLGVLSSAVAVPSIVGELGLGVWLLARGGRAR
jgi:hypothetical protein